MIRTSSATDRFILTLIGSVILHVFVLLAVSFNVFSPLSNAPVNQLDITLVKQQTEQAPDEPSYLAQVTNEGGGETEEKSPEPTPDLAVPIAEESLSSTAASPAVVPKEIHPIPVETAEIITSEPVIEAVPTVEDVLPIVIPVTKVTPAPPVAPIESKAEPETASKKVTTETAKRKVESTDIMTQAIAEVPETTKVAPPKISGAELIARARNEIGSLQNSLENHSKSLSETPQKRRISASTKEYAAAAYMRAWEMKVERIGNMNYPQEAKDREINGSLMLSVDIHPDGSVPPDGIVVSRSSGYKVLDDAAVRIVRLGAPYAVIPENVLKDSDMLTIIRTWKFESSRGMSAR